ncbi:2-oxoacid:ferredoxin oxidoreductase subunit beta [bacterium]|nr:2-oxoacid:ferredoxin oxidoreductase subunit beta [bacterium]
MNPLTAPDFTSDQDVRWCPGCGDYSILKQVQTILPELGRSPSETVFVSGIGCSSRFPYYLNTYGLHGIHGRATSIASGLKMLRPELSVWVITGDGDGLSIGGNQLIHLLRRNLDLQILLFNNEIYGLTKGQFSPTSELGKHTKSSPWGSIDHPFNPLALALGADATFVARGLDRDPVHLRGVLKAAAAHRGSSLVEIYQNCNVFNDGAFEPYSDKKLRDLSRLMLESGQPLRYGAEGEWGIVLDGLQPKVVSMADYSLNDLWIHQPEDRTKAWILSRFFDEPIGENALPRPFGMLYAEDRPRYEELLHGQLNAARDARPKQTLDELLAGHNTWTLEG